MTVSSDRRRWSWQLMWYCDCQVLQLYQITLIHHGLMMVGPSGSGKSSAWRVLLKALERLEGIEGVSHVIDPKVCCTCYLWYLHVVLLLRPGSGAEYYHQPVRVCVCLSVREHICGTAGPIGTKIFMQIPFGRSLVLLQRRCTTVKPLMLACPLFREFREPNKTAKLKGVNINCGPKQDEITTVFRIVWFYFAKLTGAKIILHAKSPTFWAAKLKCFTVCYVLTVLRMTSRLAVMGATWKMAADMWSDGDEWCGDDLNSYVRCSSSVIFAFSCWYLSPTSWLRNCQKWSHIVGFGRGMNAA